MRPINKPCNARLAHHPTTDEVNAYLHCALDGQQYGIDVKKVRRVATLGRVWKLPRLPGFVKGVTKMFGRLVPLIDLRHILGLSPVPDRADTCAVELDLATPAAVEVDSVERVTFHAHDEISRSVDWAIGIDSRTMTGMVWNGDKPSVLLDIERIVVGEAASASRADGAARQCVAGVVDRIDKIHKIHKIDRTETSQTADVTTVSEDDCGRVADTDGHGAKVEGHGFGMRYFGPLDPQRSLYPIGIANRVTVTARRERLAELLARPALVGNRRVPGFRPGSSRLVALATALLRMPPTFRGKEAAPVVAALLGCSTDVYGPAHFRYDLRKFRVRNLAERIGTSLRYRLTTIGRMVCEVFAHRRNIVSARDLHLDAVHHTKPAALSA